MDAVHPAPLVSSALSAHDFFADRSHVYVIATGKASPLMTLGAHAVLGPRIVGGIVSGASFEGDVVPCIETVSGSHPLPDATSVRAASRALDIVDRAEHAGVLVLLSGGGSAMFAAPAAGLSLDDKRAAIAALLRAGVDIVRLNRVRKHLSSVKGGRLARAGREILTLALSDVHDPEDDPATIASGPTVPDPTTYADALQILDETGCDIPSAVRQHLQRGAAGELEETPKPGDPRFDRSTFVVVGNRRLAMQGALREAERRGYVVRVLEPPTSGEAREAGRLFAEAALTMTSETGPLCLIASGEPTVRVTGGGRGGRNQEFVLGAARALAGGPHPSAVASAGTDGIDGPTPAAGAVATSMTLNQLDSLSIDIKQVLSRNDAYPALARLGDLIEWGPTGTNVGDLHIALTIGR